jgi:hypothetical protein
MKLRRRQGGWIILAAEIALLYTLYGRLPHQAFIAASALPNGVAPAAEGDDGKMAFELAMQEARRLHQLAWARADRASEPSGGGRGSRVAPETPCDIPEPIYRRLAVDPSGDLRRARQAAEQAATLARGRYEEYRALAVLALVAHEMRDHHRELWLACRMFDLAPERRQPAEMIRRASKCIGLKLRTGQKTAM